MSTSKPVMFMCGGQEYEIPRIKFGLVKQFWPLLTTLNNLQAQEAQNPSVPGTTEFANAHVDRADVVVQIIALAGAKKHSQLTAEFIRNEMDFSESILIFGTLNQLLEASGFLPQGEAVPSILQMSQTDSTAPILTH